MSLFIFIIAFQLFMGCIFMENNFYECDVLVVGSGGAGCRAAIEVAKKLNLFDSEEDLQETISFWKDYNRIQ